jgi:ABC-type Zn uptake system ZnuABC Zn-binding protein ZnuA
MKKFLLFIVLISIFSCNNDKKAEEQSALVRPKNIITKQQMIDILVDCNLAEAATTYKQKQGKDIKYYSSHYYNLIFKKYNISKEDFEKNLAFYSQNIEDIDEIYTEVINRLSKKQSQVSNE